jgi:hypothetical protein
MSSQLPAVQQSNRHARGPALVTAFLAFIMMAVSSGHASAAADEAEARAFFTKFVAAQKMRMT